MIVCIIVCISRGVISRVGRVAQATLAFGGKRPPQKEQDQQKIDFLLFHFEKLLFEFPGNPRKIDEITPLMIWH